jgi:hypothetical protein
MFDPDDLGSLMLLFGASSRRIPGSVRRSL